MTALALFVLSACGLSGTGLSAPKEAAPPPDTGIDDSGGDTDPVDTADTDGDLDDDGYTPEEGDCDDADVRVSPARPEDENDGRDNDCDGRVDEEFAGVTVAYPNFAGPSDLLVIDSVGRLDDTVRLSDDCLPIWLDHAGPDHATAGWVINNAQMSVNYVAPDGTCSMLADFSETDWGLWGVATGPDGTIYAVTWDSLVSVALDGTVTTLATWALDFDTPNVEFIASGVAVDQATGTVGLFDYVGGFATWTPEDGLRIHLAPDLENVALMTYSGTHLDGERDNGWYMPAFDTATGAFGIYRFDISANAWTPEEAWSVSGDWNPFMLALDGETGDGYVTATGGWYRSVWRVVNGSGAAYDLYMTDGTEDDRTFYGVVTNYD
jgi:hypothetical protein